MRHYKAILFDLNGTVVNIWTDETQNELYRTMSNLLCTLGIMLSPDEFRKLFFDLMKQQRKNNPSEHAEFNAVDIFRTIRDTRSTIYTKSLPHGFYDNLPEMLAQVFRSASMQRLETYPGVHEVLDDLVLKYRVAAVSDAQKIWADAELRRLDLTRYFTIKVISSEIGVRKPSPELFQTALQMLKISPDEAVFVGNDMFRDVYGAKKAGMKCVFFRSNQGDWEPHGEEPDYIIYDFRELPKAIAFLEDKYHGIGRK